MIGTFFIEIFMVLYLILRYILTPTLRIAALIIVLLAVFQLSEFGICEGYILSGRDWVKIGFGAITLLPPLGIHLVYTLKKSRLGYRAAFLYIPAIMWISAFVFGDIMNGQGCSGNYVTFQIKKPFDLLYYAWYDILLVYAIAKAWLQTQGVKNKRLVAAHWSVIVGYLAFILPSIAVRLLFEFNDKTASALPSIMCGFAVIFAGILTYKLAPNVAKKKD